MSGHREKQQEAVGGQRESMPLGDRNGVNARTLNIPFIKRRSAKLSFSS